MPPITLRACALWSPASIRRSPSIHRARSGPRAPRRRPAPCRRAARAGGRRPATASSETSSSLPSSLTRRAVLGARSSSARIAPRGRLARAQFQHLAEQHQHGDDGGGLEIDRDRAVVAAEGRRENAGREAWRRRCRRRRRRCPCAISVNMLRLRVTQRLPAAHEERPAGPQHHRRREARTEASSTASARSSCARRRDAPPISSTNDRQRQRERRSRTAASCRRVRDWGRLSAVAISGSSAMPQIGQEPGPTWRISRMHRAGVDRAGRHRARGCGFGVQIFCRIGGEFGAAAGRAEIIGVARDARARCLAVCGSTVMPQTGSMTPLSPAAPCAVCRQHARMVVRRSVRMYLDGLLKPIPRRGYIARMQQGQPRRRCSNGSAGSKARCAASRAWSRTTATASTS